MLIVTIVLPAVKKVCNQKESKVERYDKYGVLISSGRYKRF